MFRKVLASTALAAAVTLTVMPAAYAGKANDTLVWATNREVAVADPYFNNTRELVIMGNTVWDGLLFRDLKTGDYKPLLAKSYKWVDTTTIDFELRTDVVFHDGSKFGPEDVVYTVNFVSKEENGVLTQANVKFLDSATQTGPNSVRIKLKEPFPAALAYFAQAIFIMPEGHYEKAPVGADGKKDYAAVKPVGTGPYMITKVIAGDRIEMVRNDKYFKGGPKGTAAIKNLTFRSIKEMNTQVAELLTGGLDWIWDVPKDQAEKLGGSGAVTVTNAKTMRFSYLSFDVNGSSGDKHFMDKRVREAVAHAINRKSIVDNLVGAPSVVLDAACHPDQFGCTQDVPKWSYDPAKAKALLKEAGYPNGFTTDIYAYRQREFTEAVIGDLANVGIKANLKFMQYRALRELVWKGTTPLHHMTWGSNSIPDASASVGHFFSGGHDDPAKDTTVVAALKEADASVDDKVRKAKYKEALSRISGELYWLPMFTYAKYYAYSSDLSFVPTSDEIPRFFTAKWK